MIKFRIRVTKSRRQPVWVRRVDDHKYLVTSDRLQAQLFGKLEAEDHLDIIRVNAGWGASLEPVHE